MISIENNQECFVQLWRMLERTRQLLTRQCKRFCIRRFYHLCWFTTFYKNLCYCLELVTHSPVTNVHYFYDT